MNIDPSTAYSIFDWDHLAKFCQVENIGESIWSEYGATLQSGPVSIEQPVYNILEELPIARENTLFGTELVYNVLEANGQGDAESCGDNGSLPLEVKIHNTLEETKHAEDCNVKRDNEPVYNIIKRPINWQIWRQSIFLSWIELKNMLY